MDSGSEQKITNELIALVRSIAAYRANVLGLRGADVDDHIGDAYLALCLLAAEWNADSGVPLQVWVTSNLRNRMYDIARSRIPGLRGGRNLKQIPRDIDESALTGPGRIPEGTDWFVWEAAQDERDVLLLHLLQEGMLSKQEIAEVLGVSPSRVSQLITGIRKRSTRILRETP